MSNCTLQLGKVINTNKIKFVDYEDSWSIFENDRNFYEKFGFHNQND